MQRRIFLFICLVVVASAPIPAQGTKGNPNLRKITIGMIGKIGKNPVFIAAYTGAFVAAKELGAKYKIDVVIDWQTPDVENVEEQAAAIKRLAESGANGIAVACTDANYLTPIIDEASNKGIPIACFDSDAPMSKRFAYCGADDLEFGRMLVKGLVPELKRGGTIAVLAGNRNALNQQRRLAGIRQELKKHPRLSLPSSNVYHHLETTEAALETVGRAQKENPNISGWIFQGSWALLGKQSMGWKPGEIKVVAGNAVQAELERIKSGDVQALVGVNCFQMGYEAVGLLLDKILNDRAPKEPLRYVPLTLVTKTNVDEWLLNWRKWLLKEAVVR